MLASTRRADKLGVSMRCAFLICVAVAALAGPGLAVEPGSELVPPRLEASPEIDGRLDDPVWRTAARAEGFTQVEPFFGEPSPVATTVLIAYDDEALYVAFDCRDDEMSQVAASVTTRDGDAGRDDIVAVMLDTFADGDSAYYFGTNLLGTQLDGTVANNGRTVDEQWDGAWTNASVVTETGWTVELRIPFDILRYSAGDDATWGVNFLREVPRRLETSVWAGPGESEWRVSAFAQLTGWSPPRGAGKWWQLIPYVLATASEDGEDDQEVGGDIRLRYKSALVADLTVNPDFALVEADVEQINLSRFELFIDEKRPFFLEGNERFDQRIQQFYSRRIGDIDWGAKVAGTLGAFDFIALGTRAELPVRDEDSDGERTESLVDADYGVFRLQRPVMGSGNVGLLAASRDANGESAGSVGLDTTLFFTETLGMTGQYLRTHGPDENGAAWFLRPAYDSASTHFHVRYTNLDRGIRDDVNAVGFLRDDNRREWDTNFTHNWWFEDSAVERLRTSINYNRYTGHDGILRAYETTANARVVLANRWDLGVRYEDEFRREDEGDFDNYRFEVDVGWDNRQGRSVELEVSRGRNFGDDLWLYEVEAEWKISDAWNAEVEVLRLDLEPDLEGRSTWIHVLRSTYYFTNDLFVKLFAQTNSAIDKENVQLLGVWRILPPFGSLQVAFQRGTSEVGEESKQGNTLFAKLAWVF